MKASLVFFTLACSLVAGPVQAQKTVAEPSVENLREVKRVYVAPLTGGMQADALRELIIASIDSAKLFVITDNPDRADAVLKGAADDHTFTDSLQKADSASGHGSSATYSGAYGLRTGSSVSAGSSESESYKIDERKHEAYAAVRLCNRDGDVLWSTTQESLGGKFRGASADVAAKIARQLMLDVDRARRPNPAPAITPKP